MEKSEVVDNETGKSSPSKCASLLHVFLVPMAVAMRYMHLRLQMPKTVWRLLV